MSKYDITMDKRLDQLAPCTPYRLGARGIVNVYLCERYGSDLETVMAAWLDRVRETPRQVGLWEQSA